MPIIERTKREKELATLIALALGSLGASVEAGRPDFARFTEEATSAFSQTLTNVYVDAANALAGTQNVELDEEAQIGWVVGLVFDLEEKRGPHLRFEPLVRFLPCG